MAKRKFTTRRSVRANPTIKSSDILADAAKAVDDIQRTVRVLANVLTKQMRELHGGEWWFNLDHETKFIVIRQCTDKAIRIDKSELREAV